jgi:hypothetical protein
MLAMISKMFGLYQINIGSPKPSLEGAILEFDTLTALNKYLKNPNPKPWSDAWIILKKESGYPTYIFHKFRKIIE